MEVYDLGSAVRVQTEHKTTTPFSTTETLYDPDTVTVTIYDKTGTAKVTDQAMAKHATGQYYYVMQTLTSWPKGENRVETTATGPTYNDIQVSSFTLI